MSTADELAKLDQLRKDGVLTDAEFEAQKHKLLGQHATQEINSAPAYSDITYVPTFKQWPTQVGLMFTFGLLGISVSLFLPAYRKAGGQVVRVTKLRKAIFQISAAIINTILISLLADAHTDAPSSAPAVSSVERSDDASTAVAARDNPVTDTDWQYVTQHDDLTNKDQPTVVQTVEAGEGLLQTQVVCKADGVHLSIAHSPKGDGDVDCDKFGFKQELLPNNTSGIIGEYTLNGGAPRQWDVATSYCNVADTILITKAGDHMFGVYGIDPLNISLHALLLASDFRLRVTSENGQNFVVKASPADNPAFKKFVNHCDAAQEALK